MPIKVHFGSFDWMKKGYEQELKEVHENI